MLFGPRTRSQLATMARLDLGSAPGTGGPLSDGIKQAALRALRATTPGWKDTENDRQQQEVLSRGFSMRPLTGGFTNAVYRCSKPGGANSTVLLRSYGKGTEMFFSRDAELKAFKVLAEKGFGPALLATLEDGRVEEFLPGKALVAEDIRRPTVSALIARRVAELHTLDLDGNDREPLLFQALEDFHRNTLELCGEVHGGVDVAEIGRLVARLRERLLDRNVPSNVVFCHNDLQCGNMMYNDPSSEGKTTAPSPPTTTSPQAAGATVVTEVPAPPSPTPRPRLSLIDYEYSGYNPRGFDLGNHFCEWTADYASAEPDALDVERYPSAEERGKFCRSYLAAMNGVQEDDVSAAEVEGLVVEADAYSLASHLLWAMWGLLQSKSDAAAPGFDYVNYAKERLRVYHHFSERFLPTRMD